MPSNVNDAIAPPVAGAISTRAAPGDERDGVGHRVRTRRRAGRQPRLRAAPCRASPRARPTIMPMSELTATHE